MLRGHRLAKNVEPMPFKGQALVKRGADDWFQAVMKLVFEGEGGDRAPLLLEYRGRLAQNAPQYTFVLQHGDLGRVEGEGWIAPATLMHRYWVLGDDQKRVGYESFFQVDGDRYCYSSGVMMGLRLVSGLEAELERV